MDGIQGARICCGHGMFAHNFVKIGGLLEGTYVTQGSMSTRTPGQATTTTSNQRLVGLIAKRLSGANNLV